MDLTLLLQAALLGVVEGLTEFIPVSSTGHLILLIDLLKFQGPPGKVFEIAIQLGAILAVCWAYRQKLFTVAGGLLSNRQSQHFVLHILLAFLPAAVIGVFAHHAIKTYLFNPYVVSTTLILGGIAILAIERIAAHRAPRYHDTESLTPRAALAIGFCQTVAMIPGVSRSGATIMGALLLGVDRRAATEFSFFLAIPTMLAATAYDLYKNAAILSADNMMVIIVGFLAAFLSALLVVRTVLRIVSTHGFKPFAYYRIALGVGMWWLLM